MPLVSQSFSWEHGVFLGAALKSEATAAAEHKGKMIMHDPFSMRPFFGYNFGRYLEHWLSLGRGGERIMPQIFMVNWFRKSAKGDFLWPGFGENIRVIKWCLQRCDGEEGTAESSPIGWVPTPTSLDLTGLKEPLDMEAIFSTPSEFWRDEIAELRKYFAQQVGNSLPEEINHQLNQLESRFNQ